MADIYIELTITNNCNCACKYCFEGQHTCEKRNINIENRQLQLLVDACKTFDKNKYRRFIISFWGGEPFLNTEFMYKIIENTYTYDFVYYHCYSNGTLFDEFNNFIKKDFFNKIKHRFTMQISYDGEPHHTIKRGNNSELILKAAKLLHDNGLEIQFKATLSYDLLNKLPDCWKSYKQLKEIFGNNIQYYPTLDTSTTPTDTDFEVWKQQIFEVAKLEYQNIKDGNSIVFSWFDKGKKMNCAIANTIHLHNDGKAYLCHGCPYLTVDMKDKFIKGDIFNINSIYDFISDEFDVPINKQCLICDATHCAQCHVSLLHKDDDIYKEWTKCRTNNTIKCNYFKYFGFISKLLHLAVLKLNERE